MIKHFIVNAVAAALDGRPVTDRMIELMFDPIEGQDEVVFVDATTMEELAVLADIHPSKGQARKNGFRGPIPWGLNLFGTKKKRFWVWNPIQHDEPIEILQAFDFTKRWFAK